MRANFLQELASIRTEVKEMGDKTTLSVRTAVNSFIGNNAETALRSRQYEKEVDDMYKQIDDRCIATIATQQPAAADLRFLVSSIKIANEIERVADYANNIAKIVQKKFPRMDLAALTPLSEKVKKIGDLAAGMLADAIKAYDVNDANLASQVRERDAEVNKLNKALLKDILNVAVSDPISQEAVLEYNVAIRYIERVADRATNIAELVFYTATGYRMKDKKS
ncbi:Phosphate-specific transport system accessory protein PhoU [Sporomusa carbonis]|uniref:phosphate signaling complex protein PhoU n=1 Tax=Sporomusa carbonis TaxID=3076075 RepID=UPI003A5FB428